MAHMGIPLCVTLRDIESHSGHRAVVEGVYHQIDARMRPKGPPKYDGPAAIRLEDGTEVLLEPSWSAAGIRDPDERARHEGKRVQVTGVVHSQAPEPAEPLVQILGPCVSPVEDVRLAGEGAPP